jgi:hypothetical protein
MDSQLFTLSKIFTERLFRIPDYQRGYAWTERQWKDFWNDIQQIEEGSNHYTGVLTLESVPLRDHAAWSEDKWIIESKSYEPFYVVDGQQRLTTSIILIQAMLEFVDVDKEINYTSPSEIRKKFIFDTKDGGISRSYIFGYDKDNPSYEFLKTRVFGEFSSSSSAEETVYTNNLEGAKAYFIGRIAELPPGEIETLYKKVTQGLLFNIFTISDDVDVCVAFETMNNRGKPLSYLELLKNRLIYLSLKFNEGPSEKSRLRTSINDCWKAIYHSLGRNKARPLDDDLFLGTHYLLYFSKPASPDDETENDAEAPVEITRFQYVRRGSRREDHYTRLLQDVFVQRRVIQPPNGTGELGLTDIYEYVKSLQVAVQHWYQIFNPSSMQEDESTSAWLDKLERIGNKEFLPIILAVLLRVHKDSERATIFKALERFIFLTKLFSHQYYFVLVDGNFLNEAVLLYHGKLSAKQVATKIADAAASLVDAPQTMNDVRQNFKSRGFYSWGALRYFLYEYNLEMQLRSKTERRKLHWRELVDRDSDGRTIEHIYPQNARSAYWTERFFGLTTKQREALRNSLGNLLPLSQPKNSSLSNKPFPDKVEGRREAVIGYRYGCYAENEVSKEDEWTPDHIRQRGLKLLAFLEKRWGVTLGSEEDKVEMLGLEFLG